MKNGIVIAFCVGLVTGCASVPYINPVSTPPPGATKPQITSAHGPLTAAQSKAVLLRNSTEPGDAGMLQRHLAIEQEVA
jgi:glycosyltransferase A (GT-A) superfamily protein (DUF2064 family)